ncbi:hypothetical protein predicted by Glimmer/Critica [Streptococcus dysgalactiae subsp. equisimilis AC-2713]|uniref:Uncharacterized protein n=1 Tax=Streptococcus dysgalactiae subsp. equisimilis AC-2713 TaxID=759913 RepID=A0AB33R6J3_STREQ|nr:hypothetical protein predicted by Glimmer/Critica [Streptococcus dysgalactiae subsp. equisimilis AC-2713]
MKASIIEEKATDLSMIFVRKIKNFLTIIEKGHILVL